MGTMIFDVIAKAGVWIFAAAVLLQPLVIGVSWFENGYRPTSRFKGTVEFLGLSVASMMVTAVAAGLVLSLWIAVGAVAYGWTP